MLVCYFHRLSRHILSKSRIAALSSSAVRMSSWNYEDQEGWSRLPQSQSNGQNQSPINIITKNSQEGSQVSPIVFKGYNEALRGTWTRNSHSLRFDPLSTAGAPSITTHNGDYVLRQFHFHWSNQPGCGSEHQVDGSSFDAELHLVHEKDGSNAVNAHDHLTVLGVLLKRGGGAGGEGIWGLLKNVPQLDKKIEIEVTLDHLLPASKTYWHYSGSLTTPPCSEVVQWYVFSQHLIVPDEVIQKWSTLPSESVLPSNYRNVQQLNGRNVWLMRDSN